MQWGQGAIQPEENMSYNMSDEEYLYTLIIAVDETHPALV